MDQTQPRWRRTTQDLIPILRPTPPARKYDIYPAFSLEPGKINHGFEALAARLRDLRRVVIDGYGGVFWEEFRARLDEALKTLGVEAHWQNVERAWLPEAEIDALLAPFLGGDDPIFGKRFTGQLADFFDARALAAMRPGEEAGPQIIYGCGAALAGWDEATLVYVDLPKNEIQFRSRAGSVVNLGAASAQPAKAMYKRFYFVDWVALNAHKQTLLPRIDWVVDGQREEPVWMTGEDLRAGLTTMTRNYVRVRPWFEPGPWGGKWIERNIPLLNSDVPNYAWSFELIVPENGVLFESDGMLLEVSFDFLMFQDAPAMLGDAARRFGVEWPVRFDFLDTVDGGNLSVQCHPRTDYIREHFGENFTQDECYYMLECEPGAIVNIGFVEDIQPEEFRKALEESFEKGTPVDMARYVRQEPARKHDLFLIPNGTIHGSGSGNLVLEISATPYIFTFKMYDWLRMDLDGKPRPLNIARAFENLDFSRKGQAAQETLVSRPVVIETGPDWTLEHVPTHPVQFYDVHRYTIGSAVMVRTQGSGHTLSLVEGTEVLLKTKHGSQQRFHYAETFVVPAAAEEYELINESGEPIKVVKVFIKPDAIN